MEFWKNENRSIRRKERWQESNARVGIDWAIISKCGEREGIQENRKTGVSNTARAEPHHARWSEKV
jgi:hypothetical protein